MGGGSSKTKQKLEPVEDEKKPAAVSAPRAAAQQEGCDAIAAAVRHLSNDAADAADLQLSSLSIEDAGVEQLSRAIPQSKRLERLNLGVNQITDAGAQMLAQTLATSSLKYLSLERNQLTSEGVAAISKACPPAIETLHLGRNSVGAAGAEAIASSGMRLHTLGLGFAALQPEGAKAIAAALNQLKVLDVSGNHLGPVGAMHLASRLPGSTLETLKLESNGVGDDGARDLASSLGSNTCLLRLEVRRNSVTDIGAKHFAQAIEKNKTLVHLDLFDNSITDIGANALLQSARAAKSRGSALKKLDLEINDISKSIMAEIASALK